MGPGRGPNDSFCGGHSNAVGLRAYFDATITPARFGLPSSSNNAASQPATQTKLVDLGREVRVGTQIKVDGVWWVVEGVGPALGGHRGRVRGDGF